jgi:hypothetical protein
LRVGELGEFVEGDVLELGALVAQVVGFGVEVPEGERGAGGKRPGVVVA